MRNSKAKALRREARQIVEGSNLPLVAYSETKYYKVVSGLMGNGVVEVYTRKLTDSFRKVYQMLKRMEG